VIIKTAIIFVVITERRLIGLSFSFKYQFLVCQAGACQLVARRALSYFLYMLLMFPQHFFVLAV